MITSILVTAAGGGGFLLGRRSCQFSVKDVVAEGKKKAEKTVEAQRAANGVIPRVGHATVVEGRSLDGLGAVNPYKAICPKPKDGWGSDYANAGSRECKHCPTIAELTKVVNYSVKEANAKYGRPYGGTYKVKFQGTNSSKLKYEIRDRPGALVCFEYDLNGDIRRFEVLKKGELSLNVAPESTRCTFVRRLVLAGGTKLVDVQKVLKKRAWIGRCNMVASKSDIKDTFLPSLDYGLILTWKSVKDGLGKGQSGGGSSLGIGSVMKIAGGVALMSAGIPLGAGLIAGGVAEAASAAGVPPGIAAAAAAGAMGVAGGGSMASVFESAAKSATARGEKAVATQLTKLKGEAGRVSGGITDSYLDQLVKDTENDTVRSSDVLVKKLSKEDRKYAFAMAAADSEMRAVVFRNRLASKQPQYQEEARGQMNSMGWDDEKQDELFGRAKAARGLTTGEKAAAAAAEKASAAAVQTAVDKALAQRGLAPGQSAGQGQGLTQPLVPQTEEPKSNLILYSGLAAAALAAITAAVVVVKGQS
jgi:hypothetical protein